jgi:hypothetical protein
MFIINCVISIIETLAQLLVQREYLYLKRCYQQSTHGLKMDFKV